MSAQYPTHYLPAKPPLKHAARINSKSTPQNENGSNIAKKLSSAEDSSTDDTKSESTLSTGPSPATSVNSTSDDSSIERPSASKHQDTICANAKAESLSAFKIPNRSSNIDVKDNTIIKLDMFSSNLLSSTMSFYWEHNQDQSKLL